MLEFLRVDYFPAQSIKSNKIAQACTVFRDGGGGYIRYREQYGNGMIICAADNREAKKKLR